MEWLENADGTADLTVEVTGIELADMGEYLAEFLGSKDRRRIWLQCALFLYTDDKREKRDLRERYEPDRFRSFGNGNRRYLVISGKQYPWSRRGAAFERAFGTRGMYERAEGARGRNIRIDRAVVQLVYAPKGRPNARM